jgi:hypothetical protein
MSKKKMSDIYGVSTVVVPRGEEGKYKGMSVELNSQYLQFIHQRIKDNPEICVDSCGARKVSVNFKYRKEFKPLYDEVLDIIREKKKERPDMKIQFSDIYRFLFDDFKAKQEQESEKSGPESVGEPKDTLEGK